MNRTYEQLSTDIENACRELLSKRRVYQKTIISVCKKHDVKESHIRFLLGWEDLTKKCFYNYIR